MKQIVKPGGALEIPTAAEILDPINKVLKSLGQDARFVRVVNTFLTDGTGNIPANGVGPEDGFLWAVMLATTDLGNGTGKWALWVNNVTPLNRVANTQTGSGATAFSKAQLVLKGNDKLIIANDGAAAAVNYNGGLALHVIEVPFAHEAQLLL
jgi:hypothetical protein